MSCSAIIVMTISSVGEPPPTIRLYSSNIRNYNHHECNPIIVVVTRVLFICAEEGEEEVTEYDDVPESE